MFCENCGSSVNPGSITCPNCGMPVATNSYSSESRVEIKTTGLLVWSILELICLSPLFGLIALILYFTSLKSAVASGDLGLVYKSKRTIKIILIVGLLLELLIVFLVSVPNFSGIQSNMAVRADISTAAHVGKSTRIWYTDALSNPELAELYNDEEVTSKFVRIDNIVSLDNYLSPNHFPTNYRNDRGQREDATYYVHISNAGDPANEKVIVAIGPKELTSSDSFYYMSANKITEADYDGTGSGIAYVEP